VEFEITVLPFNAIDDGQLSKTNVKKSRNEKQKYSDKDVLQNIIMTLEVMCGSNTKPNTTSSGGPELSLG
jgi:hypothetical protein